MEAVLGQVQLLEPEVVLQEVWDNPVIENELKFVELIEHNGTL